MKKSNDSFGKPDGGQVDKKIIYLQQQKNYLKKPIHGFPPKKKTSSKSQGAGKIWVFVQFAGFMALLAYTLHTCSV